jgi:S1-C subfamily serine protease
VKLPRPPDWTLYLAIAGGLALLAVYAPWRGEPPPWEGREGAPLAPASPFDPAVLAKASTAGPGSGTAFSVDSRGVWLTARHVVEGCARAVIVTAPGHGVAAAVRLTPGRETAILTTNGGAPALPIAPAAPLRRGLTLFHPGYPRQQPGEAVSVLRRRATLLVGGHGLRAEGVLVLAEVARAPAFAGDLEGLSGAPALDGEGRVVGVTVAEAPRRRRLYVTTPSSLRAALAEAGVDPSSASGEALTPATYATASDRLRFDLSVAEVACLAS